MSRKEILSLCILFGATCFPGNFITAQENKSYSDQDIEARVQELVSQMTLSEKIRQMSGRISPRLVFHALGYGKYSTFNTRENRGLDIPGIRFIDGPRGINLKGSTCFPVAMARGATWDEELNERVGEAVGYEARAGGANFFGGVCINLLRHPSWGRSQETFGEDPYHLGVMGSSMTRGVQRHVMACAKHFAANSIEESRFYVDVQVDERTLREIYLPHFRMCVDEGVASIMSAYNDVNGYLCGHNKHLLRDILKGDWGFKGFVISDFGLGVEDTVDAANAGLDIEMPMTQHYGRSLKKAVKQGRVSEEIIDEAVTRILRQKLKYQHLEDASGYDKARVAGPEHAALARETAEKGMVLLKNNGSALPLELEKIKAIAVIGGLADTQNIGDRGSSVVRPPYVITPLEGIKEKAGNSLNVIYNTGQNISSAKDAARGADAVIIVAGFTYLDEGEGNDREDLNLHEDDEDLIKALSEENDRCIVVLEGGGAITMEAWRDDVQAILMAWYPGMEGGRAIADVIFGDVNPSGKLPLTIPRSDEQLYDFDNKAKTVRYDYYHGYRYFDKEGFEPAFPFGFGLSYTEYKYSNLKLDRNKVARGGKITARVDVKNMGDMAGEEVVQLYVGYKGSAIDRPVKDLKGFSRVSLEPGEKKTVSFELKPEDMAYYNVQKKSWEIEYIDYIVYAGPSSRQADLLTETFRVKGP
jgi:beta-glucosidase